MTNNQLLENFSIDHLLPAKIVMDQIISKKEASQVVQQLPAMTVYHLICDVGLSDSTEFLALCSVSQIQACLDLDCWNKDKIVLDRVWDWLEALLELGDHRAAQLIDSMDHEWLVSFFSQAVDVYETKEDTHKPPPMDPKGFFYETPDTFYIVDILPGAHAFLAQKILDELYRLDLDKARRVLMGLVWDVAAQTEEEAYRLHVSRMSDMGFYDPYEALSIYKEIDCNRVTPLENSAPTLGLDDRLFFPKLLQEAMQGIHPLYKRLLLLDASTQKLVGWQVLLLANQALSAEGLLINADDEGNQLFVMRRTIGYLSLGVDFLVNSSAVKDQLPALWLGQKDFVVMEELENEILKVIFSKISVVRIFQVGYTLARKVLRAARLFLKHIFEQENIQADLLDVLPAAQREAIKSLIFSIRPMVHSMLEDENKKEERPWMSLVDVERLTRMIESLFQIHQFITKVLGVPQALLYSRDKKIHRGKQISYISVVGTVLGNFLLGRPAAFVSLSLEDFSQVCHLICPQKGEVLTTDACFMRLTQLITQRIKDRSLDSQSALIVDLPAVREFIQSVVLSLTRDINVMVGYMQQSNFQLRHLPDAVIETFSGVCLE